MPAHHNANVWAILGASGTGKSEFIKRWLAETQPARLLIWDYKGEYSRFAKSARSIAALANACINAGAAGPLQARYRPTGDDDETERSFGQFCRIAYHWQNACVLVEELSVVTSPSFAPQSWRVLCVMGRDRGLHVVGASQFPAQIDKSFLGNATLIHSGGLRTEPHRKAVAIELDIKPDELRLLPLQWIEKNFSTGAMRRGKLAFPARRA